MFGSISEKSYHPQMSSRNAMTSLPCGVSSDARRFDCNAFTSSMFSRSIIRLLRFGELRFRLPGILGDLGADLHLGHVPLSLRTLCPRFSYLLHLVVIPQHFHVRARDTPDLIRHLVGVNFVENLRVVLSHLPDHGEARDKRVKLCAPLRLSQYPDKINLVFGTQKNLIRWRRKLPAAGKNADCPGD